VHTRTQVALERGHYPLALALYDAGGRVRSGAEGLERAVGLAASAYSREDVATLVTLDGTAIELYNLLEDGGAAEPLALLAFLPRYKIKYIVNFRITVKGGQTLMHAVAMRGDVRACEALLGFGADVNSLDQLGRAPIDLAIRARHWACVWLFLQQQIDFCALDILCKLENDSPPLSVEDAQRILERLLSNPAKAHVEVCMLLVEVNRAAISQEAAFALLDTLHDLPETVMARPELSALLNGCHVVDIFALRFQPTIYPAFVPPPRDVQDSHQMSYGGGLVQMAGSSLARLVELSYGRAGEEEDWLDEEGDEDTDEDEGDEQDREAGEAAAGDDEDQSEQVARRIERRQQRAQRKQRRQVTFSSTAPLQSGERTDDSSPWSARQSFERRRMPGERGSVGDRESAYPVSPTSPHVASPHHTAEFAATSRTPKSRMSRGRGATPLGMGAAGDDEGEVDGDLSSPGSKPASPTGSRPRSKALVNRASSGKPADYGSVKKKSRWNLVKKAVKYKGKREAAPEWELSAEWKARLGWILEDVEQREADL
jgi:hypothetical protein